ncbi:MAG TPA: hypothetical protein VKS78_01845 [Roseiarcus sp.]|nr:hypothetical protein [Roseiarcus sp.]
MRLTNANIDRVLTQFDARPIPPDHPLSERLNTVFGEHTFFLDGHGLKIVEPEAPDEAGPEMGRVVKLASWIDEGQTKLAPHEWEFTDEVVLLGKAA